MEIFTLRNFNQALEHLPFHSAIGVTIQSGQELISTDTINFVSLLNSSESSLGPMVHSITRIMFALFFVPSVTWVAASYNLAVGVSYLTMGCIQAFRTENKTEEDLKAINQQFYAAFVRLFTAVYDFAIGYFLTTRLALFGAIVYGFAPQRLMDYHHKIFKKPEPPKPLSSEPEVGNPNPKPAEDIFPHSLDPCCLIHQGAEKMVATFRSRPLPGPSKGQEPAHEGDAPGKGAVGPVPGENT